MVTVSCWLGRHSRPTPSSLSASLVSEGGTWAINSEFDSNSTGVNIELPILPQCYYLSLILCPRYIIPKDQNRVRILFNANQSFRRERSDPKPSSHSHCFAGELVFLWMSLSWHPFNYCPGVYETCMLLVIGWGKVLQNPLIGRLLTRNLLPVFICFYSERELYERWEHRGQVGIMHINCVLYLSWWDS